MLFSTEQFDMTSLITAMVEMLSDLKVAFPRLKKFVKHWLNFALKHSSPDSHRPFVHLSCLIMCFMMTRRAAVIFKGGLFLSRSPN